MPLSRVSCLTLSLSRLLPAVVLATGVFSTPLLATQIPVIGDAQVSRALPDLNTGSLPNLVVGGGNSALIQFDLSSYLPSGTTSAQVSKATLVFYINEVDVPGDVSIQALNSGWYEANVTYTNQPVAGALLGVITASRANRYVVLDVTELVRQWVDNPSGNHGFDFSSETAKIVLDSKENSAAGHAAWMDVTLKNQGAAGPAGLTGPIGPRGVAGVAGVIGPVGPQGLAGVAGLAGPQGAVGPIGPQGLVGPQGTIDYQGVYNPSTSYLLNQVVSDTDHLNSYVAVAPTENSPLTNTFAWEPLASQGAQGLPGLQGAPGLQGVAGVEGGAGPVGPAGPTGATGPVGPSGPPGSTNLASFAFNASWTNPGSGAQTTFYVSPMADTELTSENNNSINEEGGNFAVAPSSCTMAALNVGVNTYASLPSFDSTTVTVYRNGEATSMTCNVSSFSSSGSCSDTSDTFAVNAGDSLSLAFSETNAQPVNKISTSLICNGTNAITL